MSGSDSAAERTKERMNSLEAAGSRLRNNFSFFHCIAFDGTKPTARKSFLSMSMHEYSFSFLPGPKCASVGASLEILVPFLVP